MDLPDGQFRAFSLRLQLWQYVTLPRNPFWKSAGVTWQSKPKAGIGLIDEQSLRQFVKRSVLGQTQEFIDAFSKANAKKESAQTD